MNLQSLCCMNRLRLIYFVCFFLSQVRVQVEDVNEPPQFPPEVYKASVFSIAPFKTPIIYVKVNTSSFYHFHVSGKINSMLMLYDYCRSY